MNHISGRRFLLLSVAVGLAGGAGCRATVAGDPDRPIRIEAHVTVDVRQIKEEAHSIEDLVSGQPPAKGQKPQSRLNCWTGALAWAEEGGLSSEVMAAVSSRRARYDQLKSCKGQGLIGEDNEGHVIPFGGNAEAQKLAQEENQDREVIYRAQVKEKGLPPDAIGTVRAAFAQEQRERAEPGEKIQQPSGEWVTR